MLEAIFALFACQLIGEALAKGLRLPVPGPVLGMLLLFILLQFWTWRNPSNLAGADEKSPKLYETSLDKSATFLLSHLSLLFVPAGVGIISHLKIISQHGVGLVVALIVSTALSLAATAIVFARLSKAVETPDPQSKGDSE
jgi:holin-like protein